MRQQANDENIMMMTIMMMQMMVMMMVMMMAMMMMMVMVMVKVAQCVLHPLNINSEDAQIDIALKGYRIMRVLIFLALCSEHGLKDILLTR